MKLKFTACLLLLSVWIAPLSNLLAQGTAFTYQGRLNSSGGTANGTYDFRFRLASDPLANNYVGTYLTNGLIVTNGLFTSTMDFGPGIFTGSNYWLEVDVRTNGAGTYTDLSPLQQLTPTPYAVFANSSSNLLGALPAGQLSGPIPNGNLPASPSFSGTVTANTFAGNGVNISNVDALALNGLVSSNFWQLGGNNVGAGQFIGSTNNQPVEIWAGNGRAFRLEPGLYGAPNIIGGSPANFVSNSIYGATIAGGGIVNLYPAIGTNAVTVPFGTVGGGYDNWVFGANSFWGGVIAGGEANSMTNARDAVISGGQGNVNNASSSVIGGGLDNFINVYCNQSVIGGGWGNRVSSSDLYDNTMFIGGGFDNTNSGPAAVIVAGEYNLVGPTAFASSIGGGYNNIIQSNANYGTIGGGNYNLISQQTANGTIGGGTSNYVNGISGTVAGGEQNSASAFRDTVGGGILNTANGGISTVAGGWTNMATGNGAAVLGGAFNLASGLSGAVGGGAYNQATNYYSTVPGGYYNVAGGAYSFAAGYQAQATNDGAFVWADAEGVPFTSATTNQFNVRANGGVRFVTSGAGVTVDGSLLLANGNGINIQTNFDGAPNVIGGSSANYVVSGVAGATIGGGGATNYYYYSGPIFYTNSVTGDFGTVGGGAFNSAADYSFVGGGYTNTASGNSATVGGGEENTASGYYEPTVGGGYQNTASGYYYPTVGGGAANTASGAWSTVAGGGGNTAGPYAAYYSTVGGGNDNTASGYASTVSGGFGNVASGDDSFIGGGGNPGNQAAGKWSVVAGGVANSASGYIATIGGGQNNTNNGNVGTIAGGQNNSIPQSLYQPTIGGGYGNIASNLYSTVPGGILNIAGGADSFAAGQQAQALHQGSFVWADSQNSAFASTANDQFNVRAQGGVRFVTSGAGLTVDGFPVLASGNGSGISIQNNSSGAPTIIEGSPGNFASVVGATIGGGGATNYSGQVGPNSVLGDFGTVSGGFSNTVTATYGTVGGGRENTAYSTASTVAGGYQNYAGQYGAVGGGESNVIAFTVDHATIAGGNHNKITAMSPPLAAVITI